MELHKIVRDVPHFPKHGVMYKDITPVLKDPKAFQQMVKQMVTAVEGQKIDRIVGIESRGFILASAMAYEMGLGFSPIRKKGKLPWKTKTASYALEYGTDQVEIHEDAIHAGEKILIVDDVLATGGTANAAVELIRALEGDLVGIEVFIELEFLGGKERLGEVPLTSIIKY